MNQKSTLIIIPHYGSDDLLTGLLSSLVVEWEGALGSRREVVIPFAWGEIYVVNNNLENRGFTRGCNEGIKYALAQDFRTVWLLNNDTVVPDVGAAVRDFLCELDLHPKTGVIGAKILSLTNPDFIHHGGTTAVFPGGLHKHGFVSKGDLATRTRERWVTGASFVISRECLVHVGLLDEQFFNYASDSDYCYRARAAGFDVIYLPVPILHAIGESAHPSPMQLEVLRSDMTHFEKKWITGRLFAELEKDVL